jgi:mannosyltransferase
VTLVTLLGLALRLTHLDKTFVGDELSTLYVVKGTSLLDSLRTVSSDAEISPPLYFALAWLFTKLSSAPEMARVPALLAGTMSIPLVFMVGRRAVGRTAGVIAAVVMALNPFMIFYSTDARGYTVAIALLLGSTLAMLIAVQTGRRRWWVAYGALTCLCMYAHYTTAFVLGAQLLWLLWAHPEARRAALAANVGAAVAFLPWVPSLLEDFRSPTIDILSQLQGDGFDVKREAFESWAFGYPFNTTERVPGEIALAVGIAGLAIAAAFVAVRMLAPRFAAIRERGLDRPPATVEPRGMSLVMLLFLATPFAEAALLFLGGSDLLGARNLNTASSGFALSIGALLVAAGPMIGAACAAAVLAAFAVGAVKSTETSTSTIDFRSAAEFINEHAGPGDVVVDMLSPVLAPVPLTPIDVYLSPRPNEYRVYLTPGPPPFLDFPPDPVPILKDALAAAGGGRLWLVAAHDSITTGPGGRLTLQVPPGNPVDGVLEKLPLPPGSSIVEQRSYPGLGPVELYEIDLSP